MKEYTYKNCNMYPKVGDRVVIKNKKYRFAIRCTVVEVSPDGVFVFVEQNKTKHLTNELKLYSRPLWEDQITFGVVKEDL